MGLIKAPLGWPHWEKMAIYLESSPFPRFQEIKISREIAELLITSELVFDVSSKMDQLSRLYVTNFKIEKARFWNSVK